MFLIRTCYLHAALLALTAAAYLPLWHNDFIDFDDEVYITNNPQVLGGLNRAGLRWAWEGGEAPYWMPLTWLSLQLDASCFASKGARGEPALPAAAVHGENLLWHGATALLLFGFWRRVTGARWRGFLVAALFAVHPMHVESVAWAAERKDVLSGFFGAVTLWAYARHRDNPGRKWRLILGAAFLASLLSKPMLITLPFLLLLLDYWPLRRPRPAPPLVEKAPLFVLAACAAGWTLASRYDHGALVSLGDLPWPDRVANGLTAYGWYLSRTFRPVGLAVLYPHPHGNWSPLPALAGAGALLCLTALAAWQARRRPWLIVGWLWFVGALVPVIGLAQGGGQAWADRFSYWPHVGLFAALVWGFGELVERLRVPAGVAGVAAALALGWLGALTWAQVGYWRDSRALWEHAVAVTSDNDRAHLHLSIVYRRRGLLAEADSHFAEACRLQVNGRGTTAIPAKALSNRSAQSGAASPPPGESPRAGQQ